MSVGESAVGEVAVGELPASGAPVVVPIDSINVELLATTIDLSIHKTTTRRVRPRTITVYEADTMTDLYFSPKDPAEDLKYGIDFTAVLNVGEQITAAVFTASVHKRTGATPTDLVLTGDADIDAAPLVKQRVSGGTNGTTYRLKATVTTDSVPARTLVGSALLPVVDGA